MLHSKKSFLGITYSIEVLRFPIESTTISGKINIEKPKYVLMKIKGLLKQIRSTIRDLLSVIGTFVSFIPALPFGNLKYRNLEKEKTALNV